jgi:hypothetical protein
MEYGDLQEVFRLLELREEYTAFIADLESELAYLKHFMDCKLYWEKAKMMVNRERCEYTWWSSLFSRMLPESLGEDQGLVESCPRLDDYGDLEAFIAARVRWRIHRVEGIRGDAEIELADLQDRLSSGCEVDVGMMGTIKTIHQRQPRYPQHKHF